MTSATPDQQLPLACPAQFPNCPVNLQKVQASGPVAEEPKHDQSFILQKIQPALLGLMDGSVSTLAPIFATAGLTGKPMDAFFVGLAASVGAGISMGLAEALSDDGVVSGRGNPISRGVITGAATILGGMLHTLPFLNRDLHTALMLAYVVVLVELIAIAFIKYRYMRSPLAQTVTQVVVGGAVVFGVGVWLGRLGAGG
ncbi:VIT family protein [Deinococcus radiomollis]|uniref:VIT1/CCC1 transporter family protein n=1 Tax=Deinococcus radiomollis TaxID=468916 RepID=UPI003891A41B